MTTENQENTAAPAPAADENKIMTERRAKLAAIREAGVAFPNDFKPQHKAAALVEQYDAMTREDDEDRVRVLAEEGGGLGQAGRPDELAVRLGDPGVPDRRRGRREASREDVILRGRAEGVRGVADRPVAGAAAEVAAHRVQVEPVGAVLALGVVDVVEGLVGVVGRFRVGRPVGAVVLGGHAADEAGRRC